MNVTPLVDIVLVLLIIFMVVIPAMEEGIEVELPKVINVGDEADADTNPFVLVLTESGRVYLDDELVSDESIEAKLREASMREPNRKLMLRADAAVRYGDARRLFHVAQSAGFPGVSLRANQPEDAVATAAP
jgi:biopolymer transport protein TolR